MRAWATSGPAARARSSHARRRSALRAASTSSGGVAAHDAHARSALAPALRALHAAVVERDREAAARLGIELGHVAPARERPLEHARRQLWVDERHSLSATWLSISSA